MTLELDTDHLVLTPVTLDDLDLYIELFTDPEVTRYAFDVSTSEEVTQDFPQEIKRCCGGSIGQWCAIDKKSGEKLGISALLPMPIDQDDTDYSLVEGPHLPEGDIEIGYFLKPSVWGKSYGTEMAQRMVRFAFEETTLGEVVATFDPENQASRNVLLKAGFEEVGTRYCYSEENCPDFRITRNQWLRREVSIA